MKSISKIVCVALAAGLPVAAHSQTYPEKPVRIWSRAGRRPIFAAGNSNGDVPMLAWADGLRLLVLHDDAEREFAYVSRAETFAEPEPITEVGERLGWVVVSMRRDWETIFATA